MCCPSNKAAPMSRPRTRRTRLIATAALALVAAAAAAWLAYRSEIHAAQQRLEGRSTVVESPYGAIEYAVAGQGPPVLTIHGTGGGFDQGLEMVGPLADHGYQLIAPSRFGYLRSSWPDDVSPEAQADAFAWLLDRLGQPRVAVLGGSAGAISAMQFAIRHPDRCQALILLVPATYAPSRRPNTSGAQNRLAESMMQAWLKSDFLFWLSLKLAPNQMTRLLLATEPEVVRAAGPAESERVANVLIAGAPPPYPLERITCPVLAISAKDDLFGTYPAAEYAAGGVPDGRLLGFDSGGHILAGRDAEVWRGVAEFLSRTEHGQVAAAAR
jgi:2-hydroxy-6-oxonona-2,4-dienedioate hydrolase